MNKVRATAWMMLVTAVASALMLVLPPLIRSGRATERAARVTLGRVETGTVSQVTAAAGTLRGRGEYAALSPMTGVVEAVYVSSGDRVQPGEALLRLAGDAQEQAAQAALRGKGEAAMAVEVPGVDLSGLNAAAAREADAAVRAAALAMDSLTIRAQAEGVVRRVNVTERGGVALGTPVMTLSSEEVEITCMLVEHDAVGIVPGMQARVLYDGQAMGRATVHSVGSVISADDLAGDLAQGGVRLCPVTLLPKEPLDLPMGSGVTVEIIRREAAQVPVVPLEAVSGEDTVRWVSEGRCYEIPVTVLLADETSCWVDLPLGTEVVLAGEETVEGQRVREEAHAVD